jgi:hypothetical protein
MFLTVTLACAFSYTARSSANTRFFNNCSTPTFLFDPGPYNLHPQTRTHKINSMNTNAPKGAAAASALTPEPPLLPNPHSQCASCNSAGTERCGGCHDILYCSKACQQADWKVHKLLCKSFQDFQERPTKTSIRAIYFAVDEIRPRFVWLECDKYGAIDIAHLAALFKQKIMLGMTFFDCYAPLN